MTVTTALPILDVSPQRPVYAQGPRDLGAVQLLRISVTDRCNFRCPYCMPAEIYGERYHFLPKSDLLTFEEIARLARIAVGMGVNKVRLTGGEPLVRGEIEALVAMLSEIDGLEDLTMTTNGYMLPLKAQVLREAGLKRVTISMDTMDDEVFKQLNGRGFSTAKVLQGIAAAEKSGLQPIKTLTAFSLTEPLDFYSGFPYQMMGFKVIKFLLSTVRPQSWRLFIFFAPFPDSITVPTITSFYVSPTPIEITVLDTLS